MFQGFTGTHGAAEAYFCYRKGLRSALRPSDSVSPIGSAGHSLVPPAAALRRFRETCAGTAVVAPGIAGRPAAATIAR